MRHLATVKRFCKCLPEQPYDKNTADLNNNNNNTSNNNKHGSVGQIEYFYTSKTTDLNINNTNNNEHAYAGQT
jgi:hypothetical protein